MNVIKDIREQSGFTQSDLASKSGLSLRTIQRLEKSKEPPKGHSLQVISEVFKIKPVELSQKYHHREPRIGTDHDRLSLINLSTLMFFLFPFGNVFLPIVLWKRSQLPQGSEDFARRIINFQILWSLAMSLSLILTPFLGIKKIAGFPLIIIVLIAALIINYAIVFLTSKKIRKNDLDFLNLPIRFI